MTTMLIAQNETRESGSFMGDQLCSLKAAYLFVENTPGMDKVIMSVSRANEMHFLWTKFVEKYDVELVWDDWNPGDWNSRWTAWDKWRTERSIEGRPFDHYRELYLRIHGGTRQTLLCGSERGLGRANIYEYWYFGQENMPELPPVDSDCPSSTHGGKFSVHGVPTRYSFGSDLIHHPVPMPTRDVYISPMAKTQGNYTFTFDFWSDVAHRLIDSDVSVTVGYDRYFCGDLENHPLYRRHWGDHEQWMCAVCSHKFVACGNTGTGWLAAACGVPMVTMEPPHSQMPDHRYRECGLRNIVEVVSEPDAEYVARRITEEVQRCVVMTTGCYDVLHAGHVRHLQRSRVLGSKLIVALNSDKSVRALKGPERPINPQEQRKAVLEALRCVDEVRVFDGPDATELIREVKPQVLTAGFGYTPDKIVGRHLVDGWGGKVVVTCTGDASNEPSTTKIVKRVRQADVIEVCRAAQPYSVNPLDKLKLMADHFLTVKDLPGDVADLGTCKGGTAMVLRRLAPDKHLHLFDTWEGTPYNDPLCHHRKGEWTVSLEECQKLVGNGELTDYYKGVFPDIAHNWWIEREDRGFCFVYVDMDTEQATRDAIEFFWPRLVPGGKMVIDDYGWEPCAGVQKVVDEFCVNNRHVPDDLNWEVVQSLYTCVVEKR